MKPFRFIIAIFGVLLLLVMSNAQGNPALRASQEVCFSQDNSPPPAQMIAIQPEFGQSLQVERGVSVPFMFSTQSTPEAVATAKGSGPTYYINISQVNLQKNSRGVNPAVSQSLIVVNPASEKPGIGNREYLICASDLGDWRTSQTYLNTYSEYRDYSTGFTYLYAVFTLQSKRKSLR